MAFWVQARHEPADTSSSCASSIVDSLDDDDGLGPWPRPLRHQHTSADTTTPDPRPVCFVLHAARTHHDDAYAHVHAHHPSRTPSPRWRNGGSFRTHAGCCSGSRLLSSSSSSSPQPHARRSDLHQASTGVRHPKAHSSHAAPWAREWEAGRRSPLACLQRQREDEEEQQYRDERDHPWDEPWPPPQKHHQPPPWPTGPAGPEASVVYERLPLPPPPPQPPVQARSPVPIHDPAAAYAAVGAGPLHDAALLTSDTALMTDAEAAARVAAHLAGVTRRCPAARHERILLGLIHPKSAAAAFALDAGALESLFSAANALFFYGRLTRRVRWEWDDDAGRALGHTLVRRARGRGPGGGPAGGFETLIRLSRPLLTDRRYGRRLLLSAFLHELIHCYLFVCCGWGARAGGGHTAGFRAIAHTIDRWAGPANNLHLRHVEADLERFRQDAEAEAAAAAAATIAADEGTEPYYADNYLRPDRWAW